jgi:phosphate transport system substrate-binding protein
MQAVEPDPISFRGERMKVFFKSLAVGAAFAATAVAVQAQEVTGAGATFPAPLYAKWAAEYNKATNIKINYQSVGSGAGLRQIRGKTVDFGASDLPLTDAELEKDGLLQFPTVIGGLVPAYNLPGIATRQVRFTGQVLADIYLGKITKWNDPALVALNPNVKLPDAAIAVVRRADGSGTTFIWTNYLSKVSAEWKQRAGEGTAVNWPTGMGGKGNEGVSAFVQRLPNSIGYIEYAYAKANKLTYGLVRNAAGNYPEPDSATFQAAAASAEWSKTFYQILTEQPGKDAWPITGATFIMMQKQTDKPAQSLASLRFFDWAFDKGDQMALDLEYVPMPDAVVNAIRQNWAQMRDASGQPVYKR